MGTITVLFLEKWDYPKFTIEFDSAKTRKIVSDSARGYRLKTGLKNVPEDSELGSILTLHLEKLKELGAVIKFHCPYCEKDYRGKDMVFEEYDETTPFLSGSFGYILKCPAGHRLLKRRTGVS